MADSVPLETWKAWLKWKVVRQHASLLDRELVDADFAFYGGTLRGIPENRPRWKRAVAAVEGSLGEAVGKLYVARHFPPEAKERMDAMVKNIMAAYGRGHPRPRLDEPDHQSRKRSPSWRPSTRRSAIRRSGATTPRW